MTSNPSPQFLYLPKNQWSPRYEDSFYTVRVEAFQRFEVAPAEIPSALGGNSHHPCFYFKIILQRGHTTKEIWRRFSNFQWLYNRVQAAPPRVDEGNSGADNPLKLPPGTCWPFQSEQLGEKRVKLLGEFLDDMLCRPGYANHPSVLTFLELSGD